MKRTPQPIGQKFGMLTLIAEAPDRIKKYDLQTVVRRMSLVRCDCGKDLVIHYGNLIYGMTKSCGCSSLEIKLETIKKSESVIITKIEPSDTKKELKRKLTNIRLIESGLISGKLNSSWISLMHERTREFLDLTK